jgi:hypothetical protein
MLIALNVANAAGKAQDAGSADSCSTVTAVLTTEPGPEYQSDVRLYQGIPGIERDKSGRLWATWYTGGRGEGIDNYVVVVNSDDDGITWSKPKLVIDPPGDARAFDPCLWVDPQGNLILFYAQANVIKGKLHDGRWGVWYTRCENPHMDNATWTKPVRICDGIMMNKPTVLRNGAWLLPVAMWEDSKHGAGVVRSLDNGKTFQWIGGAGSNGLEHMIIERKDDSLWMLMRHGEGVAESFSQDGGVTWSATTKAKIDGPGSRFFIRRLSSGRLLLVNHLGFSREGERFTDWRSHMTAMLSDDDGKSWPYKLLLDERNKISYPDAVEAPNGLLYIIYDHDRHGDREILMAKCREEDIIAGKVVSKDAQLRMLIDKATGKEEQPTVSVAGNDNKDGKALRTTNPGMLYAEDVRAQQLVKGCILFSDRPYKAAEIPEVLSKAYLLPVAMDGKKTIKVERSGTVFFLTPTLQRNSNSNMKLLLEQGFEKVDLPEFPIFNPNSTANYCTLFQKDCVEGETITIDKWAVPINFVNEKVKSKKQASKGGDKTEITSLRPAKPGVLSTEDVKAQLFVKGCILFSDRPYKAAEIPAELSKAYYLPVVMDGQKTIKVERSGTVFFLTPTLQRNNNSNVKLLLEQGFEKVDLPEFPIFNPNSTANYCTLFQKDCVVGETIIIDKWAVPVFFR